MDRKNSFEDTPEARGRAQLEYVLRAEKRRLSHEVVPLVSVEESLTSESVYTGDQTRDITRVLFISRDETLLNPTKQSLDGLLNISELFDEVHILILRPGISAKHPVLRVANNVWLYTATARFWWWTPVTALRLIHEQLVFVGGLRADLIVARDPFECAVVAHYAGKRYGRPTQVHVLTDYTTKEFVTAEPHNWWRRLLPRLLLKHFASIRTATSATLEFIGRTYTIPDLKVLPRFNNYEALMRLEPTIDLKAIYKPFSFIMLYVGRLGHESTLYQVIDAARSYLHNPRVGLVVLGDGPAKKECSKRASILGVTEQLVFESRVTTIDPYLKSANVLIVTDTDAAADEVVLQGAAAGIPLIMARNSFREEIFTDGQSALLFTPNDTEQLKQKIQFILNNVGVRQLLVQAAQGIMREKFHDDPLVYKMAYRQSIEHALFTDESDEEVELATP